LQKTTLNNGVPLLPLRGLYIVMGATFILWRCAVVAWPSGNEPPVPLFGRYGQSPLQGLKLNNE